MAEIKELEAKRADLDKEINVYLKELGLIELTMPKNFEIKNSTAEFLMFVMEGKESSVQVTYKDKTIWCTEKAMATLFDVGVPAISKHLKEYLRYR